MLIDYYNFENPLSYVKQNHQFYKKHLWSYIDNCEGLILKRTWIYVLIWKTSSKTMFFCCAKKDEVSFSWILDICYVGLLVCEVNLNWCIIYHCGFQAHLLFKNLRCLLLLKCTFFIYLKNNHLINLFNYFFLKNYEKYTFGLNFWSWFYHFPMSPNQTWKSLLKHNKT
jgi:hypothetical protein